MAAPQGLQLGWLPNIGGEAQQGADIQNASSAIGHAFGDKEEAEQGVLDDTGNHPALDEYLRRRRIQTQPIYGDTPGMTSPGAA